MCFTAWVIDKLVTPGCVTTQLLLKSTSRILLNFPSPNRIASFKGSAPPDNPVPAPLGITFYDKKVFPEKYKNSLFIALHGSWNKYNGKSGYKVIFVKLDANGDYLYQEDFITGWLQDEKDWGRPVSPFIMSDGSMLVSDDKHDVIYRIKYKS